MSKLLQETEAKELLTPVFEPIALCHANAIKDLRDTLDHVATLGNGHVLKPRVKANLINNYVVNYAKQYFSNNTGIEVIDRKKMFGLLIGQKIFIRFKKLNQNFFSSNIPTNQSTAITMQLEIPDFLNRPTYVDAGYRIDQTWTSIESLHVVCRQGDVIKWKFDLGVSQSTTDNIKDLFTESEPTTQRVKLKEEVKIKKHGTEG